MPSQPQQLHVQALKGLYVLALAGHAHNSLRHMRTTRAFPAVLPAFAVLPPTVLCMRISMAAARVS